MNNFLQIKLRSTNKEALFLYKNFFINILKKQSIYYNTIYLPNKIKKITLLKSPHVYKKAREQFQLTKYQILLHIRSNITSKLLKLLFINKPTVINFKIIKNRGE